MNAQSECTCEHTVFKKKKTAGKTEKVETEDKKKRNQQVVKQHCNYKGRLSLQSRWKQRRRVLRLFL